MKPSSLSTWATSILILLAGMSTAGRSMRLALRMRVSMSANESVIMLSASSPAGLLDARNQAIAGHATKTNAADAELAIHRSRPAAQLAAQANADALARRHLDLGIRLAAGFQLRHLLFEFDVFRFGGHMRFPDRPARSASEGRPRWRFGLVIRYASRNGIPKDRSNSRASSS